MGRTERRLRAPGLSTTPPPPRDTARQIGIIEYRRLVEENYGVLQRCARRLTRTEQEAADVLHDALLVILCHETGPRDRDRFAAWARGVVRHVARRAWQRRIQRREAPMDPETVQAAELGEDLELRSLRRDLVKRTLRRFDASTLELLGRKYWLGESSEEIAANSEHSAAHVRMKIKRVFDSCGKRTVLPS